MSDAGGAPARKKVSRRRDPQDDELRDDGPLARKAKVWTDSTYRPHVLREMGVDVQDPRPWARVEMHPFPSLTNPQSALYQRQELSRDVTNVFVLSLGAEFYMPTPRNFMPDYGANPDGVVHLRKLVKLLCAAVMLALAPKKQKRSAGGSEDGGDVEVTVASAVRVTVCFERVPHRSTPGVYVAYRLWVFERFGSQICDELAQLLRNNDHKETAHTAKGSAAGNVFRRAATGGPPIPDPTLHTSITSPRYRELVQWYLGTTNVAEAVGLGDGADLSPWYGSHSSPWNLARVLSRTNAMRLISNPNYNADPRFYDESLYTGIYSEELGLRLNNFPDPTNVWRISETSLDLKTIDSLYMPYLTPNEKTYAIAKAKWVAQHGEEAAPLFHALNNRTSMGQTRNDIKALKTEVSAAHRELQARWHGKDKGPGRGNGFMKDWRRKQAHFTRAFAEVVHPFGDCPPAVQAITAARETYLDANDHSLRLPRDHMYGNLTRFGDLMVKLAWMHRAAGTVSTALKECMILEASTFSVYFRSQMNFHNLHVGVPETGKSFVMILCHDLLIPDTTMPLTNITSRAFMTENPLIGQFEYECCVCEFPATADNACASFLDCMSVFLSLPFTRFCSLRHFLFGTLL